MLGVDVARPGNVNDVNFSVPKHVLETVADPALQPEFGGEAFRAIPIHVGHGDDLNVRVVLPTGGVGRATQPAP